MTISEWIDQTFPLDHHGEILLETFSNGGQIRISPTRLAVVLQAVTNVAPSHADLSALPVASAGGWQKYFDDWKAKGLVN